ncbi:MAG: glycosyltransferase, partial [Candidatus Sungbacteria bacterium]|nr:glycosyltransferase [Candidatus Sungbacteria bacterium]
EEREKLQNQIRSLGLHDTIHLVGFIPEAGRYLTGFDIFVLPSLKEGLPYALMEAMAAGLPAAASSVGGISDLITNEKNGLLVPPKNPTALAEAIAFLAKNYPSAQILGREAQKTIARRSSVDAMIENTIRLYTAITP